MKFLQFLRGLGLLIARFALGGILIAHGVMRWQVHGIAKETAYVASYGVPYPEVVAWGATILELVGGLFLIIGALTPLVALAVLVEQILVICYISWRNGPYLLTGSGAYAGGYEYSVAIAALSLIFVVFGAGGASIDRLFRRKKNAEEDPEPIPAAASTSSGTGGAGSTSASGSTVRPGNSGSGIGQSSPYGPSSPYGSSTPTAPSNQQATPVGATRLS